MNTFVNNCYHHQCRSIYHVYPRQTFPLQALLCKVAGLKEKSLLIRNGKETTHTKKQRLESNYIIVQ